MNMKEKFDQNIAYYLNLWDENRSIELGRKQSFVTRSIRYFKLKRKLNRVCKRLTLMPDLNLEVLRQDEEVLELMAMWLQFDLLDMSDATRGDYVTATSDFIKRVKDKWPNMPSEDIFQALRNVWIMIAIQMMSQIPVTLTDAMFAYSMLYPLTDNLLDDPNISKASKCDFNHHLSSRLKGQEVQPINEQEADVFDMVRLIEIQYPRAEFPEVYESMLLIHDAQVKSLNQQKGHLEEAALRRLSFEKGAASVLADGFLVLGQLMDQQFRFLTGYGVVLQLSDDLQDIDSDRKNEHVTLFSRCFERYELSEATIKLMFLSKLTLEELPCEQPKLRSQMITLLDKSLTYLISDAVFVHKKKMPRPFVKQMDEAHAMGFYYYKKLKRTCNEWVDELKKTPYF